MIQIHVTDFWLGLAVCMVISAGSWLITESAVGVVSTYVGASLGWWVIGPHFLRKGK